VPVEEHDVFPARETKGMYLGVGKSVGTAMAGAAVILAGCAERSSRRTVTTALHRHSR